MRLSRLCYFSVMSACVAGITGCAAGLDVPTNITSRSREAFSDPKTRALAQAAAQGNVRELERLTKAGADVNLAGNLGITPAWWAIRNRSKVGFEWLLAHGADPNPNVGSITIMEMAAGYDDSSFLEIALRYKPALNQANRYTGHTPLSTAVMYSRRKNLELLIEAGVNLDEDRGQSPLSYAAGQARYDYVYLMLRAGTDNGRISNSGLLSLARTIGHRYIDPNLAAYEWRERVIGLLRQKGIEAHPPPNESKRTKPLPPDLRAREPAHKAPEATPATSHQRTSES